MTTRYQGTETDVNGAIVPGANIYVYDRTGATLQTLTDDMGNPLPNPVVSNDLGVFYFNVANPDTYFLRHFYYGREQLDEFVAVGISSDAVFKGDKGDPGPPGAGVNSPSGLISGGTVDMRSIIATYDAALGTGAEWWLPTGTYRIASNLTINNLVRFMKGAILKPDAGVTITLAGGFVFASETAQHFDISNTDSHVWAMKGRVTQWTYGAQGRVVSSDDSRAFQAMIDNQIYFQIDAIRPAAGNHLIANPLIMNYGSGTYGSYRSCNWEGPGSPYAGGASSFGGLAIEYTGYENAFEIQGARSMRFTNTAIVGPFVAMFVSTLFGNGGSVPTLDPNIMANWIPSGANPLCLSRYKMCSGVHIDPRCGAKPTAAAWAANTVYSYGTSVTNGGNLYVQTAFGISNTSASSGGPSGTGSTPIADNQCSWMYAGPATTSIAYTDYTYPAWAGVAGQYNQALSSEVEFHNCDIRGFGCGIAIKGCNSSSNGDFMHVDQCLLNYNVFPLAWGNNQARLCSITDSQLNLSNTCVSNAIIGQQVGESHLEMVNCQIGNSSRVIYFPSTGIAGSIVLENCYGEVCNIIGDGASSGPQGSCVTIRGGAFNFGHSIWWRKPSYIINTQGVVLNIDGTTFSLSSTPFIIWGDPRQCTIKADIANTLWMTGASNPSSITAGKAIMLRSTADVMFLNANQGPWTGYVRNASMYSPSGTGRLTVFFNPLAPTDALNPIPFCASQATPSYQYDNEARSVSLGGFQNQFTNTSIASFSRTGASATLTLNSAPTMANALNQGTHTGGILYHLESKTLFCVESRSGAVLTLTALNNMDSATGNPLVTIDAAGTGNWYSVPTGHFMPNAHYNFTYTASSTAVTMARNDGGTAGSGALFPANSAIAVNDVTSRNPPVLRANSLISASADGSITLGGNARLSVTKEMPLLLLART